jgi:hypothetical protein
MTTRIKRHRTRSALASRTRRRGRAGLPSARRRRLSRRGVTSVLAMMFVVIFGSLAAAMAISSQGNLRTAHTHIVVTRALGAADTGLSVAQARLQQGARMVRITRGEVTPAYAMQLWDGSFNPSDGDVFLPDGTTPAGGLADVLWDLHAVDIYTVPLAPLQAPADNPSDWLDTLPFIVETNDAGDVTQAAQVTYVPVPSLGAIRAVVTGYAWDGVMNRWISRTVQQDFRLFKRVDQAIVAPTKIMLGKNVLVNGPVAAMFDQVSVAGGHPIVTRSDFFGLDPALDRKLEDFYAAVRGDGFAGFDANGDNRLAVANALESQGISALNAEDYDGDGLADNAFGENTGDGFIDEFDIFLAHYDANSDGALVYSEELTAGTSYQGLSADFAGVDDDLAYLVDTANPDRNGDGYVDEADRTLGYLDGVVDYRDRFAKVRGTVYVGTAREYWNEYGANVDGSSVEDYRTQFQGAVRADEGEPPLAFNAQESQDVSVLDSSTFDTAQSELSSRADGAPFASQVGLGWITQNVVNADGVVIGQEINPALPTVVEGVPFGSIAPADYYERPVIEGVTFRDVVIPMGVNALFRNCTFVGVTRVQTYQSNAHPSWSFYGVQESDLSLKYPPPPPTPEFALDNDYLVPGENTAPTEDFDVARLTVNGTPYVNTKPLSNNLRFHDCLFVGSIVADKPAVFTHTRNKIQFTGATRFHEQHPDEPENAGLNPDESDLPEIRKSSMLLPTYSVDIGTNNASPNQDVNLRGLIIAGVLDVRGNATIDGALMTDFRPTPDNPALQHFGESVGNPAHFNMTLGYFSADDGDEEGMPIFEHNGEQIVGFDLDGDGIADTDDPNSGGAPVPFNGFGRITINWNPNLIMPDGLLAPMQTEPLRGSYTEGRIVRLPDAQ